MSEPITIDCQVHFKCRGRGSRRLEPGPAPEASPLPAGRVPRVARLMALALRIDERVRRGELASNAEVALLGHVTRARVSQIMSLLNLAPDLQEALLFLPRTERGRDPLILRDLLPLTAILEWGRQRHRWAERLAK